VYQVALRAGNLDLSVKVGASEAFSVLGLVLDIRFSRGFNLLALDLQGRHFPGGNLEALLIRHTCAGRLKRLHRHWWGVLHHRAGGAGCIDL
jgi:hypothetical protein